MRKNHCMRAWTQCKYISIQKNWPVDESVDHRSSIVLVYVSLNAYRLRFCFDDAGALQVLGLKVGATNQTQRFVGFKSRLFSGSF